MDIWNYITYVRVLSVVPFAPGVCQPGLRASWAGGLGKGVVEAWATFTPLLWSFPWAELLPLISAWATPQLCCSHARAWSWPPPTSWCPARPQRGPDAWCSGLGLPEKIWVETWNLLKEEENDVFCLKETLWLNCLILSEFLHSMKKWFWLKILFQLSLQAIAMCIYSSTSFKSRACFWTKISFWHLLNHASIFITEW